MSAKCEHAATFVTEGPFGEVQDECYFCGERRMRGIEIVEKAGKRVLRNIPRLSSDRSVVQPAPLPYPDERDGVRITRVKVHGHGRGAQA